MASTAPPPSTPTTSSSAMTRRARPCRGCFLRRRRRRRRARLLVGPHGQIGHCSPFTVRPVGSTASHEPPGCEPGRPLGVQRALQDDDSSGLVDDAATSARVYPAGPQVTLGTHGGKSLVDQPDGHRDPGGQLPGVRLGGRSGRPGHARTGDVGRPTTHLDGLALGHQGGQRVQVALAPAQRAHRGRDQPRGVAGRDADPDRADVDAEPDAWSHAASVAAGDPLAHRVLDRPQRLVDLAGVGAAALGDVVLAAATAAEHLRRRPAPAHRP